MQDFTTYLTRLPSTQLPAKNKAKKFNAELFYTYAQAHARGSEERGGVGSAGKSPFLDPLVWTA
jgi:hypothetical protein